MTTSSPRDEPGRDPATPGPASGDGKLPADVRELAMELGKAVQRHGLYPPDHPALEPIVEDLLDRLDRTLASRDRISLGVSPDRLVHEEGESDPSHPLLSSLAGRFHDHHVSRLTFRSGIEHEELSDFLGEVAHPPESSREALGARQEVTDEWPHVLVQPVRYEDLSMAEEARADEEAAVEVEGGAEDLWLGLARSAVAEEALEDLDEEEVPSMDTMVSALSEVTADRARARAVAARMVALAQTLNRKDDEEAVEVQDRFLHLVREVGPETIGKILSAAPEEQRQAFLQATVDWLPAGRIMEVLGEVADSRNLDVSYQMLRLLAKLASYAELDADALDPEAGAAFREQIKQLVTGWRENIVMGEGEGGEHEERMPQFSGPATPVLSEQQSFVDPGRVVRTALEVGSLGPLGRDAVQDMLDEGRSGELLELIREPPAGGAAEAVWELVDVPLAVRELLRQDPPDFEAVDALVERRGTGAVGALLDALSESESRSVRRQLFSRLAEIEGEGVTEAIVDRLDDGRWFVQRNMLALLVERGEDPDGIATLPYTRHPRIQVRQEAYKLAFRSPSDRVEAVRRALGDGDPKALSLGLGALDGLPDGSVDELVPQIRRRLEAGDLSGELARQAVRALGRSGTEEALEALLELCRTRKMWRFWTVDLAEKSPVVLEALRALARTWPDRPEARQVLSRARSADDPEMRDAARPDPEAA